MWLNWKNKYLLIVWEWEQCLKTENRKRKEVLWIFLKILILPSPLSKSKWVQTATKHLCGSIFLIPNSYLGRENTLVFNVSFYFLSPGKKMSDSNWMYCLFHSLNSYYVPAIVLDIMEPKMTKIKSLLFRSFNVVWGEFSGVGTRPVNKSLSHWVLVTSREYQTGLPNQPVVCVLGVGGEAAVVLWKVFLGRKDTV